MSPLSQTIFNILREPWKYDLPGERIKMRDLERIMGLKERGTQSTKDQPGILEIARKEIWEEKELFLVTFSGPKGGAELTSDLTKLAHARNQLSDHLSTEQRTVDFYDHVFEYLRQREIERERQRLQLALL